MGTRGRRFGRTFLISSNRRFSTKSSLVYSVTGIFKNIFTSEVTQVIR